MNSCLQFKLAVYQKRTSIIVGVSGLINIAIKSLEIKSSRVKVKWRRRERWLAHSSNPFNHFNF
jgi:hypothetical protein